MAKRIVRLDGIGTFDPALAARATSMIVQELKERRSVVTATRQAPAPQSPHANLGSAKGVERHEASESTSG
jgi:hypothetical protein